MCVVSHKGNLGGQLKLINSSAVQSGKIYDKSIMWISVTLLSHLLILCFVTSVYYSILFSDNFCIKVSVFCLAQTVTVCNWASVVLIAVSF